MGNGGKLVLPGAGKESGLAELVGLLREKGTESVFLTTALFNRIAQDEPGIFSGVREVLFGGEMVDREVVREVVREGGPARLLHVYGPTECTTFSTWQEVKALEEEATTVPIGVPLANAQVYVLNERGEAAPVGVAGELYIGGVGVGRGYVGRGGLTGDRFVPHPYEAGDGCTGREIWSVGMSVGSWSSSGARMIR